MDAVVDASVEVIAYGIACIIVVGLGKVIYAALGQVLKGVNHYKHRKEPFWEDGTTNWMEQQRNEEGISTEWLIQEGYASVDKHPKSCDASAIRDKHEDNCAADKVKKDTQRKLTKEEIARKKQEIRNRLGG